MIKPTKIEANLEGVAKLLESRRPAPGGSYWLYVLDKKIMLSHNEWKTRPGTRITRLTGGDINRGLEPSLWELIDWRIRKLKEEGKL